MRHRPDQECTGLEKFGLVSEYENTVTVCADCGAMLVAGPAPQANSADGTPPTPDVELVPVLVSTQEADFIATDDPAGE